MKTDMPCRITDERVYNPWDDDEPEDPGREQRIKDLIHEYKRDPNMIQEFLHDTDYSSTHLAAMFEAFDEDETGESWDRTRRVTLDCISNDMDEYFYGIAERQDAEDNPPMTPE